MMFKVGDKVIVKRKLVKGKPPYSTVSANSDMQKLSGKTVTIGRITDDGRYYRIIEDSNRWFWDDWMFVDARIVEGDNKVVCLKCGETFKCAKSHLIKIFSSETIFCQKCRKIEQ